MNWIPLTDESQLAAIKEKSFFTPQVIYKHSTRCNISSTVQNRLERATEWPAADYYYLDLIAYRDISNKAAADFGVAHESPQAIVIKDGKAVYDADHLGITADELAEAI